MVSKKIDKKDDDTEEDSDEQQLADNNQEYEYSDNKEDKSYEDSKESGDDNSSGEEDEPAEEDADWVKQYLSAPVTPITSVFGPNLTSSSAPFATAPPSFGPGGGQPNLVRTWN